MESIGAYLPSTVRTTQELLDRLDTPTAPDLAKISGIHRRRVYDASPDNYEDSLTLAERAATTALDRSQYLAADLDVVISCSITRTRDGDRFCLEPAFAHMLRNRLGAHGAIAFDVSNACAGMLTGILVLDRMIRSGRTHRGLVVSGEQITPIAETAVREIADPYDPQFASLTVGDAGAAVILDDQGRDGDRIDYIDLMTCAEFAELCIGMPSDKGPGVALYTDNRAMHNEDRYLLWTTRQRDFLAERGSTFADEHYDFLVHHQFSGPAIELVGKIAEREFDAAMPPALNVLSDYGNTASTSHVVVLDEYLRRGEIPAGAKVLLVPAASGVVAGYLSVTLGSPVASLAPAGSVVQR